MKRFFFALAALGCVAVAAASVVIDGKTYEMDTILHRTIGPGIVNTIVRLPGYPLNVYVLEADVTNPHLRVETTMAYNTVGRTETLANAYTRNRTATRRPVAACNANFWCVSGHGTPWTQFGLGSPFGAVVRNDTTYVNTNMTADQWNGGYDRTGASVFTHDRRVHMGHFAWSGTISSDKVGKVSFANVNRRGILGEVALWSQVYTATRQFETNWTTRTEQGTCNTDNYYLTFAEGEDWAVNKPMKMVVSKIVLAADRQTLGSYDACITASGAASASLASLAVGDVIEVTSGWTSSDCNSPVENPTIMSMVEGNAQVMHNGELTGRNNDETYNSQIYSRTAYGCNAEGTKLYMIVIDKSTSKQYGVSGGCSTAVMCTILKNMCPDVSEVINYDAGGSAEMMVGGTVINTTTEGTPRAVDCGWMLVAEGEEDNEIASIMFEDYIVKAPTYSSFTPRILGYNRNGELINENVTGFTLECDASIGTTSGSTFTAGGAAVNGTLTAIYNGMTCTVPVVTIAAKPEIMLKPTILIDDRDYPIEVTATVNNNVYFYDPSHLDWAIDDASVATVTAGVLKGVNNGDTHIVCSIDTLTDEANIKVEISATPTIDQSWDGFTFKQSGASGLALNDGVLSFKYSGGRAPYLSLKKDIAFFSLPDTIALTFNSSIPIDYIQIDARNNFITSANYMRYEVEGGYEAGKDYTLLLDIDALGGADRLSTYPITIKEIKITPNKNAATGEQSITFKEFYSHYSQHSAPALRGDVNADGVVDIQDVNILINIILGTDQASKYNGRADLTGDNATDIADVNAAVNIILG